VAVLLVLSGVLGLAVGSFLNVVIHRVPRGGSLLRPGSHCPQCLVAIRHRHNVPVLGWLLLRGRCAHCRAPISVRYPLVEAGTAVLFMAVTARIGWRPELPAYLYLAAVGIALAAIDLDVRRLPNSIVLPSYAVGVALLLPMAVVRGDWWPVGRGVLAMAALWLAFYALALAYPGGMGYGDVKLAGLLGLFLGWLGWNPVWIGAFAGFLFGALAGAVLLVRRRATRRTEIPFGPAMLAGAQLAVFAAGPIAAWYGALLVPAG
jgi:leader peptidase (prepilin peptidase)/N-methyltransferase